MRVDQLRNSVINEELDHVMLISFLSGYANPRDKISRLLQSGDLIRVKKGLYVFGPEAARKPYSIETLANQIYGPSAISLEYALSWYGMIPERVALVQSVTLSRNKLFKTPVGVFSYTHQNPELFAEGIALLTPDPTHHILMATREKALADLLMAKRPFPRSESAGELRVYLEENLRIDIKDLRRLDLPRIRRIEKIAHCTQVSLLCELIKIIREKTDA
ncbi:MAG: hypothetical protein JXA71_01125 [Chitinispirillaceae bacterium]|nr:hypothetical protein [Chitinispirillaceae bacterium]